jgi:hypothetical protein
VGTQDIRRIIADAVLYERESHELRERFEAQLPALRQQLVLPGEQPAAVLVEFVEQYIEYVPEFLENLGRISCESGIEDYIAPFLNMAEDFFLAPPEGVGGIPGLPGILDEAFLAQRLIEEVNDRHIRLHRAPLLPVDMTRANIIIHYLIGDELANRLDALVEQSVAHLIDHQRLFANFEDAGIEEASLLERWQALPCASRSVAVDLRLRTEPKDQSSASGAGGSS